MIRPLYATNSLKPSAPWQCLVTAEFTARRINFGYLSRPFVVKQHKDLAITALACERHMAMALEDQPPSQPLLSPSRRSCAELGQHPEGLPAPEACRRQGAGGDFYHPFLSQDSWDSAQPYTHQIWNLKEFTARNDAQHTSQCLNPQLSTLVTWVSVLKSIQSLNFLNEDSLAGQGANLLAEMVQVQATWHAVQHNKKL